jgi:hypothetical protein
MKVVLLVFSIFFVIGLGLLAGSYLTALHTRHFLETAVMAQGVVVENLYVHDERSNNSRTRRSSWSYYPRIRFQTTDGHEINFVSNVGSNPPSYAVNERVAVLYDPQQPYSASLNSFASLWGATVALGIAGVAFTGPGIGFFIWKRASDRKNAWLYRNGRRIQAEITGVKLDASVRINGTNPYWILCQWMDPARNEMHVFHSGHIWYDPTNYIPGKTLEVLVDPNNPHRYTVETSFLPKVV